METTAIIVLTIGLCLAIWIVTRAESLDTRVERMNRNLKEQARKKQDEYKKELQAELDRADAERIIGFLNGLRKDKDRQDPN